MNSERTAGLARRARAHAALADMTRLRIVDLLVPGDLSPSELGTALDLPSNLLAHHLAALEEAGLVVRHRSEGDRRRTYLSLTPHGRALRSGDGGHLDLPPTRRVVFVCTANTARSHLAAALWRDRSDLDVTSAGTHPGGRVDRGALAVARRHRLDLPDVAPRGLDGTLAAGDLVITVCDRAHEEVGTLSWAHWSIPDPVPDGGRAAFERVHDALAERVGPLAAWLGGTPDDRAEAGAALLDAGPPRAARSRHR